MGLAVWGNAVSGGGSLPGWWQDWCVLCWMRDGWIGGWLNGQMDGDGDGDGEWMSRPRMRFENALFFIIKQGFSDQHHHSSAFSFLPFPIETSWSLVVEVVVCACVHVLQSVCVRGCVFCKCMSIYLFIFWSNPPPNKWKSRTTTSKQTCQPLRPLKLLLSVRLKTFLAKAKWCFCCFGYFRKQYYDNIQALSLCMSGTHTHTQSHSTQILCNNTFNNNPLALQPKQLLLSSQKIQSCHILENVFRS